MERRKFSPLPRKHRRAQSEARSDIGPIEDPMEVDPVVLRCEGEERRAMAEAERLRVEEEGRRRRAEQERDKADRLRAIVEEEKRRREEEEEERLRSPRQSLPFNSRPTTPRRNRGREPRKPYVANPKNKLDVAVGVVVNKLPVNVNINIEAVADTWQDKSGKYWIGDQDPKLCFCRIVRSQTVMVRVGGGWQELSKFIGSHFADVFRVLPESPGFGSKEEKWISATGLRGREDSDTGIPPIPKTPERNTGLPSFALSAPSGRSPQSIRSTPSNNGSPGLTPLQFMRRTDYDPFARPDTPSKSPSRRPRGSASHTPRQAWRP